jgi:SAM-dependent methyltransferase
MKKIIPAPVNRNEEYFWPDPPVRSPSELEEGEWSSFCEEAVGDLLEYQKKFNGGFSTLKECIASGIVDFHSVCCPAPMFKDLGSPFNKVALEIGYGGGRLMQASAKIFSKVVGIDILGKKCSDYTASFLRENNVENFELLHYNDRSSINSESIDFVYSHIVFQHFNKIDYFHDYFALIKRSLKPGGVGCVHFGIPQYPGVPAIKERIENSGYLFWWEDHKDYGWWTTWYNPVWIKEQIENTYGLQVTIIFRPLKHPWSTEERSNQFFVHFKKPDIS